MNAILPMESHNMATTAARAFVCFVNFKDGRPARRSAALGGGAGEGTGDEVTPTEVTVECARPVATPVVGRQLANRLATDRPGGLDVDD